MRGAGRVVFSFEKSTFTLYMQRLNKKTRSYFIKHQKYI